MYILYVKHARTPARIKRERKLCTQLTLLRSRTNKEPPCGPCALDQLARERPSGNQKFYRAFVLNRRVDPHAIDAKPARSYRPRIPRVERLLRGVRLLRGDRRGPRRAVRAAAGVNTVVNQFFFPKKPRLRGAGFVAAGASSARRTTIA